MEQLRKKTVKELRQIVRSGKLFPRYSRLRKAELVSKIFKSQSRSKKKKKKKKKAKPKAKPKAKRTRKRKLILKEDIPDRDPRSPLDPRERELQQHQIRFVLNFIDGVPKGAMAIHGVGSGKTLTAVISAEVYLRKYPDSKVFVITPASLLAGFKQELYLFDEGIKKDDRYHFFTYTGYANGVRKNDKDTDCTDALLIIDEAQNLRTHINISSGGVRIDSRGNIVKRSPEITSGKRVYSILTECAMKARKTLLLSATPLVNSASDIENLMAMINQHEPFEKKSGIFNRIMNDPKAMRTYFGCRLSFFEHPPDAREIYFPAVQEEYVPIKMNENTLENYEAIEMGLKIPRLVKELNINEDSTNINAFHMGVRKASNGLGGTRSQKVNWIMDFVKGVISKTPTPSVGLTEGVIRSHTDKIVIFTHFKKISSDLISKRLRADGIPFGNINGSVPKSKRAELVKDYVEGKIKVIIISKAGAEGLNLLETGYIILMEPSWNNTEQEQVKGRGVRFMSHAKLPKSKRNVMIINLFLVKNDFDFRKDINRALNGIPVKHRNNGIDLALFEKSNAKQSRIKVALRKMMAVDPLEDCRVPADMLDPSQIFKIKSSARIPALTPWEVRFYSEEQKSSVGDLSKLDTPDETSMIRLKKEMLDLTREVYGGNKELVRLQNAFFTPAPIARDMVKLSGISTTSHPIIFLEPTAGAGFITYEALLTNDLIYSTMLENMSEFREHFLKKFPRTEVRPESNFFKLPSSEKYPVIIMNPPYTLKGGMGLLNGKATHDVDFVLKAYHDHLNPEGILVCLISNKYEFRKGKQFREFRDLLESTENVIINYEDGFTKKGGSTIKEMTTQVSLRMIKILKK